MACDNWRPTDLLIKSLQFSLWLEAPKQKQGEALKTLRNNGSVATAEPCRFDSYFRKVSVTPPISYERLVDN